MMLLDRSCFWMWFVAHLPFIIPRCCRVLNKFWRCKKVGHRSTCFLVFAVIETLTTMVQPTNHSGFPGETWGLVEWLLQPHQFGNSMVRKESKHRMWLHASCRLTLMHRVFGKMLWLMPTVTPLRLYGLSVKASLLKSYFQGLGYLLWAKPDSCSSLAIAKCQLHRRLTTLHSQNFQFIASIVQMRLTGLPSRKVTVDNLVRYLIAIEQLSRPLIPETM